MKQQSNSIRCIALCLALTCIAMVHSGRTALAAERVAQIEEQDSLPQCTELVKGCFVTSGTERANCFFSASKHPFCEGSALGDLAFKRWATSPDRPAGFEGAAAFLGPQLIDQECLGKFDNQWSSALVSGDISNNTVSTLTTTLEGCVREVSNDLNRP